MKAALALLMLVAPVAAFVPATQTQTTMTRSGVSSSSSSTSSSLRAVSDLEAILFDCDGVLADTGKRANAAFMILFNSKRVVDH